MRNVRTLLCLLVRASCALSMALHLSGCTTSLVKSAPSTAQQGPSDHLYTEYALPRSVVTLAITNADAAQEKPAPVDSPDPAPAKPAKAAGVKKAAPAPAVPQSNATSAIESKRCSALKDDYMQDRTALADGIAEYDRFKSDLSALTEKQLAQAIKLAQAYAKSRVALEQRADAASARLALINESCPVRLSINVSEAVEPDPDHVFRMYMLADDFSTDQFVAETEGGLLTSIQATGDHQGGEILAFAAKSIAAFTTGGASSSNVETSSRRSSSLADIPNKLASATTLTELRGLLGPLLSRPAVLPPLVENRLPMKGTYTLDELEAVELKDIDLAVSTKCGADPAQGAEMKDGTEGVYVSALRACQLTIVRVSSGEEEIVARATFAALDARFPHVVPVERTAFVKTTTSYTFSEGGLTKVDSSRPSPVLQVVSIPFKIIGSFVQAIADGIRGKKGEIDAQTELVKSKTALVEATSSLQKAKDAAKNEESTP